MAITNLTNTTWYVKAGWEAEAGYGAFDLNGSFNGIDGSFNGIDGMAALGIGNSKQTFTTTIAVANRITWSQGGRFQADLTPADSFFVHIIGGTDATNPKLIAWLSKYGELRVEEGDTPTLTYDLSQLNLPAGTHLITVIAKADGYADSAPSNAVEYVVKESVPTNLANYTVTVPENWSVESGYGTFDIEAKQIFDGGSYQFETIILGDIENDVIFLQKNITGLGKTLDDTSTPIVLEIWGGNDAANSQLIQWFVDNKATFTKNHSGGL